MLCGYSYSGFLYFMPQLISEFSTSQIYLIMLFQQISIVPGSLLAGFLVETRLGRRQTLSIAYMVGGIFMGLLIINKEIIFVGVILGRNYYNI